MKIIVVFFMILGGHATFGQKFEEILNLPKKDHQDLLYFFSQKGFKEKPLEIGDGIYNYVHEDGRIRYDEARQFMNGTEVPLHIMYYFNSKEILDSYFDFKQRNKPHIHKNTLFGNDKTAPMVAESESYYKLPSFPNDAIFCTVYYKSNDDKKTPFRKSTDGYKYRIDLLFYWKNTIKF